MLWTVLLEKTLESPLYFKEIQPVHPKGDQSWGFIGRTDVEAETPILWPPDVKSWLIEKDPDAGKDWGQEEKGMTEDEMFGWHHQLDGHGFGWTPGVGDGQGGLACCGSWGRKELDTTEQLNWAELEHPSWQESLYLPGIFGNWTKFYEKSFGKVHLSSDSWRTWRLHILAQIFRRGGGYRSVMQAVYDWAQIKALNTKGSGELSSWQQYCQFPHHSWKHITLSMAPWGQEAWKPHIWAPPRPCSCVSTFSWFCFVSFCSNKTVTISSGLSWLLWVVAVMKPRQWWEPSNLQLVSHGELCLSHVKSGLTWVVNGRDQSSSLSYHLLYLHQQRDCSRIPWSRAFKSLPPEHWKEGS